MSFEQALQEYFSRLVSFDTETHLFQDGLMAPPLVCGSSCTIEPGSERIMSKRPTLDFVRSLLEGDQVIVGANLAFDMAVLGAECPELIPSIFDKYDRDEVYDILIAEALHAIAEGHLGGDPRTGGPLRDPVTNQVTKRYSLANVCDLVLGRVDAKKHDFWRRRYAILERIPMPEWPADALQYPKDDVRNTLDVAVAQIPHHRNLQALGHEARAAFALHLSGVQGLRTNKEAIDNLELDALAKRAKDAAHWEGLGFTAESGKKDGKAVKARLAQAYGAFGACEVCGGTGKVTSPKSDKPVNCVQKLAPEGKRACDATGLDLRNAEMLTYTPTGGIQAGRENLADSGDEDLMSFAQYQEDDKLFSTYLPFLRRGVDHPISLRSNVIVSSGRASYEDVIMQMPRGGGIRECFEPREGFYFCSSDYSSGELCTLAQTCIDVVGYSVMADTINSTKDPGALHTKLAASIIGISLEEAQARQKSGDKQIKNYRQASKPINFGIPGGMGPVKVVIANRRKGAGMTKARDGRLYNGIRFCILLADAERCGEPLIREWQGRECPPVCRACVEAAAGIVETYKRTYPEVPAYHRRVAQEVEFRGEVVSYGTGMVRGGVGFCDGANHGFQNRLATGAKRALWLITREMYTDRNSPLYGSRVDAFFHDEVFSELPVDIAHLAGPRQADLMIQGLKTVVPDVYVDCKPALMLRWTKDAEPTYDAQGKLIPWMSKA